MEKPKQRAFVRLSRAALLVALCAALQPAIAADLEREQLATVVRQIELADRLAEQLTRMAPQERARYHFDYARLHADLERVRAGLQDYLVPQRAQPRDPVVLTGDYVRRTEQRELSP